MADIAQLQERADGGDVAAMTALGKLLLSGEQGTANIGAGAQYIAQAAAKENGEALAQLALLVAAGIANPPNWDLALDHLQRAAERGWAPAQENLRFLAKRDGRDFTGLRQSIDLAALLKPPETELVFERPRILIARNLLSKAECDRIIAKARPHLGRATIYDVTSDGENVKDERSNSTAELTLPHGDVPLVLLHARMSATLGLPSQHFEFTQILHYKPGQEFKPHYDYLNRDEPGLAANMQALGQRIVTLLVYLNEGYQGGETSFPRLNYSFKGRTGDALMFGNVNEKGQADPLTLHAGLPPRSGEKWLLSQWVRDRPLGAGAR